MSDDFYAQMGQLRAFVTPLAQHFKHPSVRSLIIRRRYVPEDSDALVTEYLEISPRPVITTVSPSLGSAFQGQQDITIEITDYQVRGIDRKKYLESDLVGSGYAYFVDAVLSPSGNCIQGGIECDFRAITMSTNTTFDLVLRARSEQEE